MNNEEYEYGGLLVNGFVMIVFTFVVIPVLTLLCALSGEEWLQVSGCIAGAVVFVFGCVGYFTQEPNESRVMIFFGTYKGTCRRVGFFWTNPFMTRRKLSLRIRNMDIEPIKVNDLDSSSLGATGTSVSQAALQNFVRIQSDAALREVTGHYAYDQTDSDSSELTLRDGGDEINELLEQKINDRLAMAGMEVVEARINYLAYAPEIAAVMLRRQQAAAIISAREKIVEGAVSMVDMALKRLEAEQVVKLDEEKKATMVSNLLVVLCADEPAQPVLNTGNN